MAGTSIAVTDVEKELRKTHWNGGIPNHYYSR